MANRKSLDDLIKQRDQLNARIADARARDAKANRKRRNAWVYAVGSLVTSHIGEWNEIDIDKLAQWLVSRHGELAGMSCKARDPQEAEDYLREWKRRGAEERRRAEAARAAAEGGAEE